MRIPPFTPDSHKAYSKHQQDILMELPGTIKPGNMSQNSIMPNENIEDAKERLKIAQLKGKLLKLKNPIPSLEIQTEITRLELEEAELRQEIRKISRQCSATPEQQRLQHLDTEQVHKISARGTVAARTPPLVEDHVNFSEPLPTER